MSPIHILLGVFPNKVMKCARTKNGLSTNLQDTFAFYVCVCVSVFGVCLLCLRVFFFFFFVQAQLIHMSDVGAHMCSGSCLFAYSALIMFYGKLLLVCGCFYSMAHLVGYNTSEGISSQSTNTTSTTQLRHTHNQ